MESDAAGCLGQRSQLDRLREVADAWARDRVLNFEAAPSRFSTTLFVVTGDRALNWNLDPLFATKDSITTTLIPQHGVMRILQEQHADAAALLTPVHDGVALQLADFDHEQSLTARILRTDAATTLGQWDFGAITWPLRLRQLLTGARHSRTKLASAVTGPAPRESRPRGGRPTSAPEPVRLRVDGRRAQMRELRDQLHREVAAAPSWLQ